MSERLIEQGIWYWLRFIFFYVKILYENVYYVTMSIIGGLLHNVTLYSQAAMLCPAL